MTERWSKYLSVNSRRSCELEEGPAVFGSSVRRTKLTGIETCRALAALLVVFHHAGANIAEPRFYGAVLLGGRLEHLHVGVDFFFVLSGFIIAWVHWADLGRPERLGRYALRRFLRIYPPYWGLLIPLVIVYLLVPALGKPHYRDLGNIAASFALAPYPMPPVIGVAWTLVHEVLFYALFGVVIALGARGTWLLPAWGALIVAAQATAPLPFPLSIVLSPYNLEFLFGIAAAVWLRNRSIPCPGLLACLGALVFAAFALMADRLPEMSIVLRLTFGLPATLVIMGLVRLEREGRVRLPSFLVFLGGASYAIYLIHGVVMAGTIHALTRVLPREVPLELVLLVLVAIGTGAGCLYYRFVERPLTEVLGRRFLAPPSVQGESVLAGSASSALKG
ncbi:acyltransferase family protein [Methylorubrum aminovorans]